MWSTGEKAQVFQVSFELNMQLNNLGSKPTGSEFVDWKSTPVLVIPVQTGIQAL